MKQLTFLARVTLPDRLFLVLNMPASEGLDPQLDPPVSFPAEPCEHAALALCEERIGCRFRDRSLLRAALTHASGADNRLESNERLEFFGDAILGFVVSEELFQRFPDYLEGDLTKIKSIVVSRQTCAKVSSQLGLESCLIVGKGISSTDHVPPSLLADVFESLVAAIYIDLGAERARAFVLEHLGPHIDAAVNGEVGRNFKSLLQQLSQKEHGTTPTYQLLDEQGPDHNKAFKILAIIGGHRYPPAWGANKKQAEQRAACNALFELRGQPAPYAAEAPDATS